MKMYSEIKILNFADIVQKINRLAKNGSTHWKIIMNCKSSEDQRGTSSDVDDKDIKIRIFS